MMVIGLVRVTRKAETKSPTRLARSRVAGAGSQGHAAEQAQWQADQAQHDAADEAQPVVVIDQRRGDEAEAEGGNGAKEGVGQGRTEAGDITGQLALTDRAVNAHDADGADRRGDDETDENSFIKIRPEFHLRRFSPARLHAWRCLRRPIRSGFDKSGASCCAH